MIENRRQSAWVVSAVFTLLFLSPSKIAFSQQQPLTLHDVTEAGSDYLMTVTSPEGYSPEEVLKTILESPQLPKHIRRPFVELAKVKAPHLLSETGGQTVAGHTRQIAQDNQQ